MTAPIITLRPKTAVYRGKGVPAPSAQRAKAPPVARQAAAREPVTPITIGQAFRVCLLLFVGFLVTPLPQFEGAKPAPAEVAQPSR